MSEHRSNPVILDTKSDLPRDPSSFLQAACGNTTWFTLLSSPQTPTSSMCAGIATCPTNGSLALHKHQQPELYYILSGLGSVEIDGKRYRVSKDTVVWIPGNAEHGVFCGPKDSLKWFYVFPEGSFDSVVYHFRHDGSGVCDSSPTHVISRL